ncbi:MAG: response regulator [Oleispira antarctica]|nr:response regulator [Oleispira antarctica]MBQ0793007.1 response regulator [Oleispira antarctica]
MINLEKALAGRRILIVDDLVEARSSLKKMATILGGDNIDVATDGIEAMSLIHEHEYDIVLSDYNLGRTKDGQQILEEARFTQRLRATSLFIVITGENAIDMVMGALEYDPDGYITKPYTLNMLKERLIRIITIKEELRKVNKAIDLQKYDLAIKYCLEVLDSNPRLRLPASRILGQLLMRQKRFQQALKIYSQLLNERSVSWAKLGQAICIFKLGDPNSALALLNRALVDHPLYVQCYDWIAKILLTLDKPLEAQAALEKAIVISPKAVLRQMELGRIAYENGDMVTAEPAFKYSVRLGRFSCHKSAKNYLQFVRSAQALLINPKERQTQNKANEAFRALTELKQDFSDDKDSLFEASIVESKTHLKMENLDEAKRSANDAEDMLAKLKCPKIDYKLQMTETFIETDQSVKAQKMIDELKSAELSDKQIIMLNRLDNDLNGEALKRHSTSLNDQGVSHYEKGELEEAIIAFDQATHYEQAGISVLLNSIQAKISLMERDSPDKKILKNVRSLLIRIGEIAKDDERFARYSRLRKTYDRLCRAAAK